MTYAVTFDDSPLAREALRRAGRIGAATGHEVVALSVVPRDPSYAAERGWTGEGEFSPEAAAAALETAAREVVADATFRHETVGPRPAPGYVAGRLRSMARDADADVVFVGSENAGRVASPLTSVGDAVESDPAYDVFLVRHAGP
ncbi:MAG: universal stress protein [Haloferacaceae archaeon]